MRLITSWTLKYIDEENETKFTIEYMKMNFALTFLPNKVIILPSMELMVVEKLGDYMSKPSLQVEISTATI